MKKFIYTILLYANSFAAALLILSYLSVYFNPIDFWLIAFIGLAYPFLLIINLVFCAFWMYGKNRLFLVSLVTILVGFNVLANHFQLPLSKKSRATAFNENPQQDHSLKLLSYNVRLFNRYDWAQNKTAKDEIFTFIQNEEPDILCLQEFYSNIGELSTEKIRSMLGDLNHSHIHYAICSTKESKYGIATFSKYPIVLKGVIQFENTFNMGIFTDILYQGDTIRVYNNHLQSIKLNKNNRDFFMKFNLKDEEQIDEFKDISSRLKRAFIKRAEQVNHISGHIKQSPHPVVVCGDFNDTPVSYTFRKMKGKLKDAFVESGFGTGNTYIGKLPSFRIDYIFYSQHFDSFNYKTIRVKHSDHYPIKCYLRLR